MTKHLLIAIIVILALTPSQSHTSYTDVQLAEAFGKLRQMLAINAYEDEVRGRDVVSILGASGANEYYEYLDAKGVGQ